MIPSLLLVLALQGGAPPTPPERSDYVCAVADETGVKSALRYSVDLHANAWCAREPACEVKTLFGVRGAQLVLESSQLEVTSYETSIDRASGAYSSVLTLAAPAMRTESRGVCTAAPFTPFDVEVSGKALKP